MKLINKIFHIFVITLFITSNVFASVEISKPLQNKNVITEHNDFGNGCSHKDIIEEHVCAICSTISKNIFIKSQITFNHIFDAKLISPEANKTYYLLLQNQSPNLRAPPYHN